MNFASLEYMIFLPVVFIFYWTLCAKSRNLQNALIVIASSVFYGWVDWRFLGLLLLTALSTFVAGLWFRKADVNSRRRLILWSVLVLNIGILFYFKYFNFFVDALVDSMHLMGMGLSVSTTNVLLPVGISFYTFTALSYTIDVYQRKVEETHDVMAYLAYVMFFPSILSGPISRAQKQLPQYFRKRKFDYDVAVSACKLILLGGGNKIMFG